MEMFLVQFSWGLFHKNDYFLLNLFVPFIGIDFDYDLYLVEPRFRLWESI
jgi:hypothetical protein